MADYLSTFTGQQVGAAVRIALDLSTTLSNYINKDDVNILVPGLVNGTIEASHLSVATTDTADVISVGDNLSIDNSVLSVDMSDYYTQEILDEKLKLKADQATVDELSDKIEQSNNYSITINRASEQNPNSIQTYYQLIIN